MFAIVKSGVIQKMVANGAFSYNGLNYPANWFYLATAEDKAAIGALPVVFDTRPDDRFYWVTEKDPVITSTEVNIGFETTPKDLAGLQKVWSDNIDRQAYQIMQSSDWMVVRAAEDGTPVPADWGTFRAFVRTTANLTKEKIVNAADVAALQTVVAAIAWPHDPNWIDPSAPEITPV